MRPLVNAITIAIESWEDLSLLAQMQRKRRSKATKVNKRLGEVVGMNLKIEVRQWGFKSD